MGELSAWRDRKPDEAILVGDREFMAIIEQRGGTLEKIQRTAERRSNIINIVIIVHNIW